MVTFLWINEGDREVVSPLEMSGENRKMRIGDITPTTNAGAGRPHSFRQMRVTRSPLSPY
jgi:hypothetical protein